MFFSKLFIHKWCLLDEIRTFLTKIRIANFDCRALRGRAENFSARAGKKEGGWWGGRNFCPPSLSPPPNFVPTKLARRL